MQHRETSRSDISYINNVQAKPPSKILSNKTRKEESKEAIIPVK
jgi:hypothetical protein